MGTLIAGPVGERERILRSLGDLPPFSPILNKLMASLASEDVSFGKLAELIEKDTVLAGNVLRLVNSAMYGRRGTINSVRHAVSLMGLTKLRNSVMSLSVASLWTSAQTPPGWDTARFNLHAFATAVMTDLVALRVPSNYPEGAFVAGLLHDIGLLLITIALPDKFREIRNRHEAGELIEEAEKAVLGFDHSELSAAALASWNLPEPIQRAVRYRYEGRRQAGEKFALNHVLRVAELAVDRLGITALGTPAPEDSGMASLLGQVALGESAEAVVGEFQREIEPMRAFF